MAETIELNTLGAVIKTAYEGQDDTNAFTNADKDKLANLADTSFSGAYVDLTGKPALFSGAWPDLTDKPLYIAAGDSREAVMSDIGAIPESEKAQANGVAPLDATGFVPVEHINVSGLAFKGPWDAAANTPELLDGVGEIGAFYKSTSAGTANFGNGNYNFLVGDWVIYAGGTWQRIGVNDSVSMVNGKMGNVVLNAADVGALPSNYTAPVASVNGKNGVVTINAAEVGALPSTYTPPAPAWTTVTGKPDFAALYQPKQRGIIGPAIPAVLARISVNKALVSAGYTYVVWDNVLYDQFNVWDGTSGFVVPSWAKHVRIRGSARFSGNSSGSRAAGIRKNGADVTGAAWSIGNSSGTGPCSREVISGVIPVVSGDLMQMMVYQNSGATLNLEPGAVQQHTWVNLEFYE